MSALADKTCYCRGKLKFGFWRDSQTGKWSWTICASNGKILARGVPVESREEMVNSIMLISGQSDTATEPHLIPVLNPLAISNQTDPGLSMTDANASRATGQGTYSGRAGTVRN